MANHELEIIRRAGKRKRAGPYTVWQLLRPGELLDDHGQAALIERIARESSKVFLHDISAYWLGRPDYFHEVTEWSVAEAHDEFVAWLGVRVWDDAPHPICYIDTLSVMPGHRRTGLGVLMTTGSWLRTARRLRAVPTMAFRTESPIVFRMLQGYSGRCQIYPSLIPAGRLARPRNRRLGEWAKEAAREVAIRTGRENLFDGENFVLRQALSGSLYGSSVPTCGDSRIDDFFSQAVDAHAGDAVIAVAPGTRRLLLQYSAVHAALLLRLGSARRDAHTSAGGQTGARPIPTGSTLPPSGGGSEGADERAE